MTTIWGFTREPSHFAYAMFFTALVCALLSAARPINKREMLTGIFATVLMLISGAFSSILLGIGLVAFFACSMVRKSKSTFNGRVDIRLSIALVGAVIAAALVGLYMLGGDSFYASKLANVIDNLPALIGQNYTQLQGTADAMPRMISIVDTFYLFLQYPLFGAGLGTVNPFSAVTGVLSNVGLIGFALWLSLLFDYARTFSGPNSARFIVLLLVAVGALNMDTGLMYSPVWLLLGGLFWSSSRMFGHHHQHSYASARTPVPLVAHKGASE